MSLLMEALKQQQGQQPMPAQPVAYTQPAPAHNAQGWKMLALLLLVLVGLLAGFLLAQYLQKPPLVAVAPVVQPASAQAARPTPPMASRRRREVATREEGWRIMKPPFSAPWPCPQPPPGAAPPCAGARCAYPPGCGPARRRPAGRRRRRCRRRASCARW